MPKPDHDHQEHAVLDDVDDAVVADADTKTRPALERPRTGWPGVLRKQGDRTLDATTNPGFELA
jgi:hypothetical protein